MRGDLVYELIGGIREEFVREAEPKCLAALVTPSTVIPRNTAPIGYHLYTVPPFGVSERRKPPRPAKRWMTAACLALAILLSAAVGLGGVALVGGMSDVGDVGASSVFGLDFMYGLFPFLSPGGTEPPYEVTVREPGEESEPEEITDPAETE